MCPASNAGVGRAPTIDLNEVSRRFSSRPADTAETRHIRGTCLAVAQDWLIRIPDCPERDAAIEHLDAAAVWASEAFARRIP